MSDTYFVVGIHGAPTPETAPHGYKWRNNRGATWSNGAPKPIQTWTEWWPLPAPPTEQAPPPEPEPRWVATWDLAGWLVRHATPDDAYSSEDARKAADALNALDRDGVAWGPGRPMDELPEVGYVLVWRVSGYCDVRHVEDAAAANLNCWWPLPAPGEAQ